MNPSLQNKNRKIGLIILAIIIIMVGLSFAAVPLYNLFCRTTGFGGTTQVAQSLPDTILDRTITVKFNADTARGMPWIFKPEQRSVNIKIGEKRLIAYSAENTNSRPITGTALYNVAPAKAGKYFHKIECFCFQEQTLQPGEKVSMPVGFYIDPSIATDRSLDDLTTITLSYSFFKLDTSELDKALEDFYNEADSNTGNNP